MKIKTFHAMTMQDALRSIKEELGPDAVILSTKQIKKGHGMFGLFGRTMVEVSAAVEERPPAASRQERRPSATRPVMQQEDHRELEWQRQDRRSRFDDQLQETLDTEEERRPPATRIAPRPPRPAPDTAGPERFQPSAKRPPRPAAEGIESARPQAPTPRTISDRDWDSVQREIQSLRTLVEATLRTEREQELEQAEQAEPELPPASVVQERQEEPADEALSRVLDTQRQDLLDRGLDPDTAWKALAEVQRMLQPDELASADAVRQALHRVLVRDVKVSGPLMNLGEWKKTVIVTGPTGVGKTTTIAKLAAQYRLKEKRSVALITLDTYRVAAVEQLRMYANVIGVSLDVALTKREALDCIRRLGKTELILIDTTGRSPMDEAGMEELRDMISLDHPLETHLVVSSTTRERDLMAGVARYGGIPITRLLFTKLDEGTGFGGMYEMMRKTKLPLSYFSTGQNVPDDLEVATADRLVSLLLGGDLRCAPKPAAAVSRPAVAGGLRAVERPAAKTVNQRQGAHQQHSYQGGAWWIKR